MEDAIIRRLVEDELASEPSFDSAGIGVAVHDGVATLTGHVRSYADFHGAERAALRVAGVRGVANELEVRLAGALRRDDEEIALDAANVLRSSALVPHELLKVAVHQGEVTLEGEVDWWYQRESAAGLVRNLIGVLKLTNHITIRRRLPNGSIKAQIENALKRTAISDPDAVQIETHGDFVLLGGSVHAWWERDEAERIAWSVGGVCHVENGILVAPLGRAAFEEAHQPVGHLD